MADFDRITQQPGMMGGKPCIRGMRVTVGLSDSLVPVAPSTSSLLTIRTLSARTSSKRCGTRPGLPRNAHRVGQRLSLLVDRKSQG